VHRHSRTILLLVALLAAACGGERGASGDSASGAAGTTDAARADRATAAAAPETLPIQEPTGPIDEALAERGEKLFSSKGCVACHSIGKGKLVGPDLMGITEKVTFPWIFHWVSDPDSMLRSDTTAQRLLKEYLVPMPNQNVSPEEFQAIYEYLRERAAREKTS